MQSKPDPCNHTCLVLLSLRPVLDRWQWYQIQQKVVIDIYAKKMPADRIEASTGGCRVCPRGAPPGLTGAHGSNTQPDCLGCSTPHRVCFCMHPCCCMCYVLVVGCNRPPAPQPCL
jgi:hypothetical protein